MIVTMKYLHKFYEYNDINKKFYGMLPVRFALIATGGSSSARVRRREPRQMGRRTHQNSNDEHIDDRRLAIVSGNWPFRYSAN